LFFVGSTRVSKTSIFIVSRARRQRFTDVTKEFQLFLGGLRAIRYKSSLVPRCGLSTTIPAANRDYPTLDFTKSKASLVNLLTISSCS
jgi:hypothetical protein